MNTKCCRKEIVFLLIISILFFGVAKAQSNKSDGHYLQWIQDNIKVYQSSNNKPKIEHYKFWNFDYWFYADEIVKGDDGTEYIKLFIPDGGNKLVVTEYPDVWDNTTRYIDDNDFNKWLFIKKEDYQRLQKDHYPKRTVSFKLSALTVPFKIHPAQVGHASSLYNSNWNVGTFIGIRVGLFNDALGINLGPVLGFASLNQTASENTAITNDASETLSALNYGGSLVFDVSKKFQLGFIIGTDHGYGEKSKTYIYQNKVWYAFSLNFNFLDLGSESKSQ